MRSAVLVALLRLWLTATAGAAGRPTGVANDRDARGPAGDFASIRGGRRRRLDTNGNGGIIAVAPNATACPTIRVSPTLTGFGNALNFLFDAYEYASRCGNRVEIVANPRGRLCDAFYKISACGDIHRRICDRLACAWSPFVTAADVVWLGDGNKLIRPESGPNATDVVIQLKTRPHPPNKCPAA